MEEIGTAKGFEESTKTIVDFLKNSTNNLLICADQYWPSVAIGIDVFNKEMFDLKKRNVNCKFITEVTSENLVFCKELQKIADVRHLHGLKGNFAVNDSEYIASATMKNLELLSQVLYSNSSAVVEQHHFFFENLWDKSISATEKINEFEKGILPEIINVIKNPIEIQRIYLNIINSSTSEIMLILTTSSAFMKDENIKINKLLEEASDKDIKVRIIIPGGNKTPNNNVDLLSKKNNIEIRCIESSFNAKINILVVDKKYSLIVELKDDTKLKFTDAIGSAVYSTSNPKVMSFVTIFDTLWKQTELYEKLKDADKLKEDYIKKLKLADKAKDEFVNVAAHELRTPTQSILNFANLLRYDTNKTESIDAIQRNARRLSILIKNILDVTKIEGNKLSLYKEKFNLSDLVSLIVKDYREQLKKHPFVRKHIKLLYKLQDGNINNINPFVYADKERITQVITNLLDNTIKFTDIDGGSITITLQTTKSDEIVNEGMQAIILIKDTGMGISEEILPHLFTKFSTRSFQGTGLGLFISKNIVEAHGGKMFAQNNEDGKGATFSFSIPLVKKDEVHDDLEVRI
ncbi:MAG TPA: ATP-binding protein [Candidatus Saccharimonadales bacterium]|nr:ATP-binding protein [Candidatus Saccharimonadales bacterium]